MKILPNLNLNKHPQECADGSLINANNIIVSSDNAVIQNEPELVNSDVNKLLKEYYKDIIYKIIYILSCNKEIVIFVKPDNIEDISLIRYNEKFNKIQFCTNIDYSGGKFVGTFTYNKTNLIIAFSEYSEDDSLNIPLRTINLGEFDKEIDEEDKNQLENKNLHPINPKVKIPNIDYSYTDGNANKGWYFIFIRYKISKNTYTQWYDTHCRFLLDSYQNKEFFKYILNNGSNTVVSNTIMSENLDYVPLGFSIIINDLDNNFDNYQLAFVIIKKGTSIVKRTEDININNNIYKYEIDNILNYNLSNILINYNNYYNIKNISTKENKLYISNYKEKELNPNDLSNISITFRFSANKITFNTFNEGSNEGPGEGSGTAGIVKSGSITATYTAGNKSYGSIAAYSVKNKNAARGTEIFYSPYYKKSSTPLWKDVKYIYNFNSEDILTIALDDGNNNYSDVTTVLAKNLFIDYLEDYDVPCDSNMYLNNDKSTYTVRGKCYRLENDELVPLFDSNKFAPYYIGANNFIRTPGAVITKVNGVDISNIPNSNLGYEADKALYIITGQETKYSSAKFKHCLDGHPINYSYNSTRSIDIIASARSQYMPKTYFRENITYPNNIIPSQLNTATIHNFFIHFVDEYGNITKGYNFNYFNFIHDEHYKDTNADTYGHSIIWYKYINKLNNLIIGGYYGGGINNIDEPHEQIAEIKINNIPNNYIGWFVSYEKTKLHDQYDCYCESISDTNTSNQIIIYNEEFNISDIINYNFDRIELYNLNYIESDNTYGNPEYFRSIYNYIDKNYSKIATYKVINKEYKPADTFGNTLNSTRIILTLSTENGNAASITPGFRGWCRCIIKDVSSLYESKNKILIPCAKICYDTNKYIELNTDDGFSTRIDTLLFKDVYFDNANFVYKQNGSNQKIIKAFSNIIQWAVRTIPFEYKIFNNKPKVIAFPVAGLDTTDVNLKAYSYGYIVEVANTIDLFNIPHYTIYDAYPKTLDWYNPDIKNNYNFPKTLRRSNIIQDETDVNYWRQFPIESYKTISENKGDVIKIIPIGNLLLVHTQYSLFMFNGADSIKSKNSEDNSNNNIQLASIDIWAINYKEILTSTYGRAGLSKQEHSIVGDFGYIWYDYESRRIYRFDNNSIVAIDDNIKNFIHKLKGFDLNIIEDINRNRLLFNFYKEDTSYILSYNYNINSFVSLHSYEYSIGYNTKNNIYIVTKDNIIKDFNDNFYDTEIYTNYRDTYNNSSINIICNTDFSKMKSIDSIIYNIRKVVNKTINDFLPVEGLDDYYAGDSIRIYNNIFDTGLIDISNNKKNNINEDYKKPYWRLGNWHFNNIRNSLLEAKDSRIYGNYFIIQFNFNTNKQIEIESIDIKLNNSTLK